MKQLSLRYAPLYLVVLLSCSAKEKPIDERERYIGTYVLIGKQSVASVGPDKNYVDTKVINSRLTITKHEEDSKIKLKIDCCAYPELVGLLEGNTFSLDLPSAQYKLPSGGMGVLLTDGNGFFINNKVTLNVTFDAIADGLTLKNTSILTGKKM